MKQLYLWLDDIRHFADYMNEDMKYSNSIKRCYSVNEAKTFLYNWFDSYDKIILDLDHDLGDFAGDGGDGYKLVLWLIMNEMNVDKVEIRCHSMNPVGKEHILSLYKRYWT